MTTDTTTTTELRPDVLTLVTVSEDYYGNGYASFGMSQRPEERTFFATAHRDPDGTPTAGYAILIIPTTDTRSEGMWALEEQRYGALLATGGLTRSDYRGWALETRYVTPLLPESAARPRSADLSEAERRDLPVEEAYPIGTVWHHYNGGDAIVVGYANDGNYVRVRVDGGETRSWVRGALDLGSTTFVGWDGADRASQSDSEAPETAREAVPAEEVDRLIAEAVAAAKQEADEALEEFKTTANRRAVEYAESNGLCSEFERCMEDIGLMGREDFHDEYDPEWRVTLTVRVTVRAADEESARSKAWSEVYEELPGEFDDTLTVLSVEEEA